MNRWIGMFRAAAAKVRPKERTGGPLRALLGRMILPAVLALLGAVAFTNCGGGGGDGGGGGGAQPAVYARFAYVANLGDNSVSSYMVDAVSGRLKYTGTVAAGTEPQIIVTDPSGKYAYAVNYGSANVSQYTIGTDGSLSPLSAPTVTAGQGPVFMAVDPSGKYAYAQNFDSNDISLYTIEADGSLTPNAPATMASRSGPISFAMTRGSAPVRAVAQYAYVAQFNGDSNLRFQGILQFYVGADGALTGMNDPDWGYNGSEPLSIAVHPGGRHAYVANVATDSVMQFNIRATAPLGELMLMQPVPDVPAGTTPSSIAVDPTGRYAYIANSGDSTVSQYTISSNGSITSMSTATVPAVNNPRAVAVDPGGRFVYVANFGGQSISMYSIGPSGALASLGTPTVGTGSNPTFVAIDPSGRYAYAANNNSSSISMYSVGADGVLVPLGTPTVATGGFPSAIAIDPGGHFAYVSANMSVWQYRIGTDGTLTPLNPASVNVNDFDNSYIAIDPGGNFAYTSSGGYIWQFAIGADGTLTALNPPSVVATYTPVSIAITATYQ